MNKGLINLRKRFVSDFNLPIQVLQDPFFDYYLDLYEEVHKTRTKWNELILMIINEYDGNYDLWLEYYAKVRDEIINTIEKMPEYIKFSQIDDMNQYKLSLKDNYPDVNIYNENFNNHILISIDLKKANFQALKYHNSKIILDTDNYKDFIGKFTNSYYIKDSKYTRQVIFGKLNPRRQVTIEKYLISKIIDSNTDFIKKLKNIGKIVSLKSDEIIFDVTNIESIFDAKKYESDIKNDLGIDVKIELFELSLMQFKTHTDNNINIWKKSFYDGSEELKSVPITYYPQVYKTWKNMDIIDDDLVFYHENQLAKFIHPILLINQ